MCFVSCDAMTDSVAGCSVGTRGVSAVRQGLGGGRVLADSRTAEQQIAAVCCFHR